MRVPRAVARFNRRFTIGESAGNQQDRGLTPRHTGTPTDLSIVPLQRSSVGTDENPLRRGLADAAAERYHCRRVNQSKPTLRRPG